MRTAEEIVTKGCGYITVTLAIPELKQIQLDAMKEGMRKAAIIAEGETYASGGMRTDYETAYEIGCIACEKAILSAAEQLTEKDL